MTYWGKVAWFAVICLVFAYASASVFRHIVGGVSKVVFLVGVTLFPLQVLWPWFSYEVIPRLALFFAGIHLLFADSRVNRFRRLVESLVYGLFFAMSTLEKAGNVFYIVVILALVGMAWWVQKLKGPLICLFGTYALGVLGLWLWASQDLAGLIPFFKSMWLFISAYPEALVKEGAVKHLVLGLIFWLVAGLLVGYRLWRCRGVSVQLVLGEVVRLLLVVALLFLSWKHGMLRAVEAHGIFFYAAAVLIIFLLTYPKASDRAASAAPDRGSQCQRGSEYVWTSFVILGLTGLVCFFSYYRRDLPALGHQEYEFQNRFRALMKWRPVEKRQELDGQFHALQKAQALPQPIRELIGDARVDEFGQCPEVLLLNKLNYRPRPVPIDFVVVTPELSRLNGQFYENPKTAPEFIFTRECGVRLTDSLAYLSVVLNYQLVGRFQDQLLLQRRRNVVSAKRSNTTSRTVRLGEWVGLEHRNASFCWAELDVKPTALGRAKNAFYKPDRLQLEFRRMDGSVQGHGVCFSALRAGFLANPIILRKDQWFQGSDGCLSLWQPVTGFRVQTETSRQAKYFEEEIELRLNTVVIASTGQAVKVDDDRSHSFFAPVVGKTSNINATTPALTPQN